MKIKEGGGMDIEKERELFLAHMRSIGSARFMFELNEDGNFDDMSMAYAWSAWQAAKAQAVSEGFILISAEQMSQWGHMANCAQEYGCPECYEARGYAHSLACEINAYFNVSEAQEPAND